VAAARLAHVDAPDEPRHQVAERHRAGEVGRDGDEGKRQRDHDDPLTCTRAPVSVRRVGRISNPSSSPYEDDGLEIRPTPTAVRSPAMDQHEAFLHAILEAPDDDAPRLVYADWLDDHGDSDRAEFIRLQCALAKLPPDAPQRPAMRQREEELLSLHSWEWAVGFGWKVQEWQFVRGFI